MKTKTRSSSKKPAAKSLGQILDLLGTARIDNPLTRASVIRDTLVVLFVSLERKEISSLDAMAISIHLRQELSSSLAGQAVPAC